MNDALILAAKARADAALIALDDALIERMVHEPWRIAKGLYGFATWPWHGDLTDHLVQAEQEHRFRLRLYGYAHHPQVRQSELIVRALLRLILE